MSTKQSNQWPELKKHCLKITRQYDISTYVALESSHSTCIHSKLRLKVTKRNFKMNFMIGVDFRSYVPDISSVSEKNNIQKVATHRAKLCHF